MTKRNKLLVVTGGYLPGKKYGGITTSRKNFADGLHSFFDIYIVTCNHDYKSQEEYTGIRKSWNDVGNAKVLYLSDSEFHTKRAEEIIDEVKPIIIYASGTITSYFSINHAFFKVARNYKVPVVITPDGDLCNNAVHSKSFKKKIAIAICRLRRVYSDKWFQTTSIEEKNNLIDIFRIHPSRIYEIPNLPCLNSPRIGYKKKKNELHVIFVSRIHPQKNLLFAIDSVSKVRSQKIVFDIYGPVEDENYWNTCIDRIRNVSNNRICIEYKGMLGQDEARDIYKQYDCLLLPTKGENYSHVIEEALVSGCPVMISKDTTPWNDVHNVAGRVFSLEEQEECVKALEEISDMDETNYSELVKSVKAYIEKRLNIKCLTDKYIEMIQDLSKSEDVHERRKCDN